jgi:hypothetical protein
MPPKSSTLLTQTNQEPSVEIYGKHGSFFYPEDGIEVFLPNVC